MATLLRRGRLALSGLMVLLSLVLMAGRAQAASQELTLVNPSPNQTTSFVFKGWKVDDQAKLADLNKQTSEELDQSSQAVFQEKMAAGQSQLKLSLDPGRYYIRELTKPGVTVQPLLLSLPRNGSNQLTVYLKAEAVTGQVQLTKLGYASASAKGETLAGVSFYLYQEGNNLPLRVDALGKLSTDDRDSRLLLTDKSGHIKVTGLPAGNYYFVEQATLSGYVKNSTPQHFTVKAGETTYVTVKNYRPTVPTNPQKPSVPKSSSSSSSSTSSSSSSSSKPKVPTQPQKPNLPSQKKKGFLPQTGEIVSWLAVFAGLVLLVFGLFLAIKSRQKKDQ